MFTGIIEECGKLRRIGQGRIEIAANFVLEDVKLGDSIAVNGICLTVTSFTGNFFAADVMPETVRRTSLAELRAGSMVNLERALTLASRLGGHLVSGHIDGTGQIVSLQEEGNASLMEIAAEKKILRGIVPKGSVALDGISLTVAAVGRQSFTVSLIPHTRSATNLSEKKMGSLLNIETDLIGKYVEKLMAAQEDSKEDTSSRMTRAFLLQHGF